MLADRPLDDSTGWRLTGDAATVAYNPVQVADAKDRKIVEAFASGGRCGAACADGSGVGSAKPRTGAPVMKAFMSERYGPPETLRLAETEKPAPKAEEVLVKVLAVSVNPADWRCLRGKPLFSRASLGLLRPKHRILGGDIAGLVEAVGSGVTQFEVGDAVYANLLDHGHGASQNTFRFRSTSCP